MIDYVIYGRIIIDKIYLKDGEIINDLLGGGSPQAAFGARLWSNSVGILVRSGVDIPAAAEKTMLSLDINTEGWVKYPDLATTQGIPIKYDKDDYRIVDLSTEEKSVHFYDRFSAFHSRVIPLPSAYQSPKAIHFLTDMPDEPMVDVALQLKNQGTLFSLEPMIDYRTGKNVREMLDLIKRADIATPDWPSACYVSDEATPLAVMKYWIQMLSDSSTRVLTIRHGGQGSYVWSRDADAIYHVPVLDIGEVDSTGCGNSYGGGLCIGWEKYGDVRIAAACATASAGVILQHIGIPAMSTELEQQAALWRDQLLESIHLL